MERKLEGGRGRGVGLRVEESGSSLLFVFFSILSPFLQNITVKIRGKSVKGSYQSLQQGNIRNAVQLAIKAFHDETLRTSGCPLCENSTKQLCARYHYFAPIRRQFG